MNGFVLRVLAMTTMLIDHIGWNFIDNSILLTWIGRIAFPLYAFLLAEGFLIIHKDKNRLTKHLSILLILVFVSEIGYDLLDFRLRITEYIESQSNIITLLLGYMGMMITEAVLPSGQEEKGERSTMRVIGLICAYALIGFSNYMLKANFNIVGPWLVIAFYWYIRAAKKAEREGNRWSWGKRILVLLFIFVCYLIPYFWVRSGFGNPARWWEEVVNYAPWVAGHVIAGLIISFYNGELGYHKKWFSRLYTAFYPLHTFVIGVICILTGR